MDFEYLRLISLDERDNGKLASISFDTFDMAREYLSELYEEAKSPENFMTRHGTELIEEIESVQSVLQSIIDLRVKKIIKLAEDLSESGRSDKEQIKRMTPAEKQMYDEIIAAISRYRNSLNFTVHAGTVTPHSKSANIEPENEIPANIVKSADTDEFGFTGEAAATEEYTTAAGFEADASPTENEIYSANATASTGANNASSAPNATGTTTVIDEISAHKTPDETAAADAAVSAESQIYDDPLDNDSDAGIWDESDFRDFAEQSGATATAYSDSAKSQETSADNPPIEYELLCIKKDIDSFMGVDNKIYSISAGDILMLPADNARVLRDRNIALNIKVSK